MGRPAVTVDRLLLETTIAKLESEQQYKNQGCLFKSVAEVYGQSIGRPISPAWIFLKIQELGIPLTTPKGRKGKQKGDGPISTGPKITRAEKIAANPKSLESLALLKKEILKERNGKFLPIFRRAEKGSMKAAIALNCLGCMNYQPSEIRNCPCISCPLHIHRPYK